METPALFVVIELDDGFLFFDIILVGLNNRKKFEMSIHYTGIFKMKRRNRTVEFNEITLFLIKQRENSQLNMKISGMERKSSGKRDSFLTQTKDTKGNMKPPAKVCFPKVYLIELLKLK